jgi:hypothetical protein
MPICSLTFLILEGQVQEANEIVRILSINYPDCMVLPCFDVASFFRELNAQSSISLIITDMNVPLFLDNEDIPAKEIDELDRNCPGIRESWRDKEAGERVVHCIRTQKASDVPIIVHTKSPATDIANTLARQDVYYCPKGKLTDPDLMETVHFLLSK